MNRFNALRLACALTLSCLVAVAVPVDVASKAPGGHARPRHAAGTSAPARQGGIARRARAARRASERPVAPAARATDTVWVTLLQVNDVYQISPVDKGTRGGLARVATIRRRVRAESPNTLLLLAGDTLSPSVASNIFRGEQMIATWNAVGLDIAAFGNHEFDFGDAVLRARMRESHFAWLAANVVDGATGRRFGDTPPYLIREFDGVRVGFFGLLTTDTRDSSKAGPSVRFLDPVATAARVVRQLHARGVRTIVAITHLTMSEDKRVARAVDLDAIIGGHEHTLLESAAGGTPIFKMGSDARNVGRVDLFVSRRTGTLESMDWEVLPVTSDVPDDPATARVVATYEAKLSAELDKPVGATSVELDALQATNRSRETNLGDLIADAYRAADGADVALLNSGSIRSNTKYPPGPISRRDVVSILPFENPVVKLEVTGATIRAALEHGVARIAENAEEGRFPQVSGLRFAFDGRRPAGSRVVAVSVGGTPLEDTKTYTLATNTFVAGGGDGYTMFRVAKVLVDAEQGPVEPAVLMSALGAVGTVAPATDGRIERLDAAGG